MRALVALLINDAIDECILLDAVMGHEKAAQWVACVQKEPA